MLRFGSKTAKKLVGTINSFPSPQCVGMIHSCAPQCGVGIPERLNQKPVAGEDPVYATCRNLRFFSCLTNSLEVRQSVFLDHQDLKMNVDYRPRSTRHPSGKNPRIWLASLTNRLRRSS